MAVAAALVRTGRKVYLPLFAPHSRVDLVVEDDHGFQRVQCKTSRLAGDVLTFRTCSNTGNVPKGYDGDIDVFGVYSPDLDAVYLVPLSDVPSRLCHLRLRAALNHQEKNVRWAADYLVA